MLSYFIQVICDISSSAEWNHLCNFGRGHYGEHSCEIILWFSRRIGLNIKKIISELSPILELCPFVENMIAILLVLKYLSML